MMVKLSGLFTRLSGYPHLTIKKLEPINKLFPGVIFLIRVKLFLRWPCPDNGLIH